MPLFSLSILVVPKTALSPASATRNRLSHPLCLPPLYSRRPSGSMRLLRLVVLLVAALVLCNAYDPYHGASHLEAGSRGLRKGTMWRSTTTTRKLNLGLKPTLANLGTMKVSCTLGIQLALRKPSIRNRLTRYLFLNSLILPLCLYRVACICPLPAPGISCQSRSTTQMMLIPKLLPDLSLRITCWARMDTTLGSLRVQAKSLRRTLR